MKNDGKNSKGITLIALIITIILLLILAGVTIHFTLGENGILRNAETAGEKYEEANAKEQLTLELSNVQAQKYKETGKKATLEDVKNLINKNKYDVTIEEGGSSATIEDLENEYTFIVDEKLTIQDVEKITNQDTSIKIETSATNKSDYTTSTLKAKITLSEEIASIKIAGNEITVGTPTNEGDKYIYEIEKEVEKNGNYKIKVETVNGNTNYKIQQVKDLSEDMEIRTAKELAWFRDRVNSGATYEGRTITLMNDIDLSSVCGENINGKEINWKPIGYWNIEEDNAIFMGRFNGQYKTINNLYININEENIEEYDNRNEIYDCNYLGLFGYNRGIIENLLMDNVYLYVDMTNSKIANKVIQCIGSVTGGSDQGELRNIGINSGSVTCINTSPSTITYRSLFAGGISGASSNTTIYNCYNNANISATNTSYYSKIIVPDNKAGGIVADLETNAHIKNCYNTGRVESYQAYTNMAGGISGRIFDGATVENCYNYREVLGSSSQNNSNYVGGIVGISGWSATNIGMITNSYCTNESATYSYYEINYKTPKTEGKVTADALKGYATNLGEEFIPDGKKVDKNGNIVDNPNGNINNGYPILKWQVTE